MARKKKTHGKCVKKGRGKGGKVICRKFAKVR